MIYQVKVVKRTSSIDLLVMEFPGTLELEGLRKLESAIYGDSNSNNCYFVVASSEKEARRMIIEFENVPLTGAQIQIAEDYFRYTLSSAIKFALEAKAEWDNRTLTNQEWKFNQHLDELVKLREKLYSLEE